MDLLEARRLLTRETGPIALRVSPSCTRPFTQDALGEAIEGQEGLTRVAVDLPHQFQPRVQTQTKDSAMSISLFLLRDAILLQPVLIGHVNKVRLGRIISPAQASKALFSARVTAVQSAFRR